MTRTVATTIGWLITIMTLVLSVLIPWSIQHHWNQESERSLAEHRNEREAGIWVYGLGVDRVIIPPPDSQLSLKEILSAIQLPHNANSLLVMRNGDRSFSSTIDIDMLKQFETTSLTAGDSLIVAHHFSPFVAFLFSTFLVVLVGSWCWMALSLLFAQIRSHSGMIGHPKWIRRAGYGLAVYSILIIGAYFLLS